MTNPVIDSVRGLLADRPRAPNMENLVEWWRKTGALLPALIGAVNAMESELLILRSEADRRLGAWQVSLELGTLRAELDRTKAELAQARRDLAGCALAMEYARG